MEKGRCQEEGHLAKGKCLKEGQEEKGQCSKEEQEEKPEKNRERKSKEGKLLHGRNGLGQSCKSKVVVLLDRFSERMGPSHPLASLVARWR